MLTLQLFNISSMIFKVIYTIYNKFSNTFLTFAKVKLQKSITINFNVYNKFNVLINNKYYNFILVNDLNIDSIKLQENSEKYIDTILNCTLISDNKYVDITKYLQMFSIYLSKNCITWKVFLDYVLFQLKNENITLKDYYMEITLNDDNMTIYYEKISDIFDQNLCLTNKIIVL